MAGDTKIVGLLCHWCAYSASDAAAAAKLPVPPNLRTMRVPCTDIGIQCSYGLMTVCTCFSSGWQCAY